MILCGHELPQDVRYFPLTQDSVLLADFAAPKPGDRVLDLGAGQGWLGILMQERVRCAVDGLEREAGAAAAAAENYRRCGCLGAIRAGDWRERAALTAGAYELCVSNPPYFAAGSGPAGRLSGARTAENGGAEALCAAAFYALRNGGRFCLCAPAERLADWLCALRGARLEPKLLRPVCRRAGLAPALLLLEAKKDGKAGLRWLPPLVLETRAGAPTAELRRIYGTKDGGQAPFSGE